MLIPQEAQCQAPVRQGSRQSLEELRRQLGHPSSLSDGNRQRLLDLQARLARVRALGDEFTRVEFSDSARQVVTGQALASA